MNTEIDIYANIVGFNNYQVSTFGNVKNVKTGRILKPSIDSHGYLIVNLSCDGERSSKNIHKMVAIAFLENPENKRRVDHIDRCRANNHISNLRWATLSENQHNRSINLNNISGVTGVRFEKASQKWRATITADWRQIHLGYYEDKNDAIVARQNAEIQHFGQYRAQNI